MALDHYVSQVHLRNFYSDTLKRLHAFRKHDLFEFDPPSDDVCRIEDGNTNKFLREPRFVEEILKSVEPNYNKALQGFRSGAPSADDIYAIAMFIAYVQTCSPTGIRLHSTLHKRKLERQAKAMDADGLLPKPPEGLDAATFTELLESKRIEFTIDPFYPQAVGITLLMEILTDLTNSRWEIVTNPFADSPFFTSDFPLGHKLNVGQYRTLIVPLAPDIAVCVSSPRARHKADLFALFDSRNRVATRREVAVMNKLIVNCAEDLVFANVREDWMATFVKKNARTRLEVVFVQRNGAEHFQFLVR